jgi:glycogen synthase
MISSGGALSRLPDMRILLLGSYPPPHGGVATHIVGIRRYLRDRGVSCEVVNLTRFREPRGEGIYCPRSAFEVSMLLARLRFDVAHLHVGASFAPRLLALGLVCCARPGTRTVVSLHSGGYPDSREARERRSLLVRGFVLRRFDRVVGVNQAIVEAVGRFGVPASRVRLISPFVPPPEPATARLPTPLAAFFQDHEPMLVSVGGLEPHYDVPTQIEALGRVRQRFPNAGLAVIGSGASEGDVRRRIAAASYSGDVLICGDLPHPAALAAIRESDVFLRTSLYDGDSVSVREAMHFGVPVVATRTHSRPVGVELVPPNDPSAVAEAVIGCLARDRRNPPARADGEDGLRATLDLYTELAGETMNDER